MKANVKHSLKMEATCFSETSVVYQRVTWRYTPEDRALQQNSLVHSGKQMSTNMLLATMCISASLPVMLVHCKNTQACCYKPSRSSQRIIFPLHFVTYSPHRKTSQIKAVGIHLFMFCVTFSLSMSRFCSENWSYLTRASCKRDLQATYTTNTT
jgi:hypothetical protein